MRQRPTAFRRGKRVCVVWGWGVFDMGESRHAIGVASNRRAPKFRSKKTLPKNLFRTLAKHRFPSKTAEHIEALTGYPVSTVYDWMADRSDAPAVVIFALLT